MFFVKLENRGLIQIEGEERQAFLQNLVSNDIGLLATQRCVYACLLTPQGKFLHDFFIQEGPGVLLLDCEGGARAQDLYKRLNLYRLRAKVAISVEDHHPVYAVLPPHPSSSSPHPNPPPFARGEGMGGGYVADPRHPALGWRCFEKPQGLEEQPFAAWDRHRIGLCVPDGSRDMVPEQSTLLECRIDTLNGISFKKGCYVGQELTARMHYRGLAKKHLYAVQGTLPAPGSAIMAGDVVAGEMRSSCGDVGLALLKDELAEKTPYRITS